MAVKKMAGREARGKIAAKFAELNDDVLFGQVWSRQTSFPCKTAALKQW